MIVDMHCHLYEFDDREIERILENEKDLIIVAVSDDLSSFNRTLELNERYPDRIVTCAGFHPWNIGEKSLAEVDEIIRRAYRRDVTCIGEVGLDRKFVPKTISLQYEVFRKFLYFAKEIDGFVNIHAPDAWKEALSLLKEVDVDRAMFHWYTGPIDLVHVIGEEGYKISINPALKVQKKHQKVAEVTPLDYIVFESDGPYNYKGLRLTPLMVKDAIKEVAKIKGVDLNTVLDHAVENSLKLIVRSL